MLAHLNLIQDSDFTRIAGAMPSEVHCYLPANSRDYTKRVLPGLDVRALGPIIKGGIVFKSTFFGGWML